ncbi:ATP-dependent Clp protease proteolytic subunit [Streptomyces sp. DT24]|uniref:ATP-dependent Clp protease proteolytic subunit n=1 Tax=unclassified Streptomyces TaxID=2593676 RepID=UPI003CF21CFE
MRVSGGGQDHERPARGGRTRASARPAERRHVLPGARALLQQPSFDGPVQGRPSGLEIEARELVRVRAMLTEMPAPQGSEEAVGSPCPPAPRVDRPSAATRLCDVRCSSLVRRRHPPGGGVARLAYPGWTTTGTACSTAGAPPVVRCDRDLEHPLSTRTDQS